MVSSQTVLSIFNEFLVKISLEVQNPIDVLYSCEIQIID